MPVTINNSPILLTNFRESLAICAHGYYHMYSKIGNSNRKKSEHINWKFKWAESLNWNFTIYDNLETYCGTWLHGQINFGQISLQLQNVKHLDFILPQTQFKHLPWCGCTCMFWLYLQAVNDEECSYVLSISTSNGPLQVSCSTPTQILTDNSRLIV